MSDVAMARAWAMPSAATFDLEPVARLMDRWLVACAVVVDPFARNSKRGTHRNDMDTGTTAESHIDATSYLHQLHAAGVVADAVLLDPPYSPRQISEHYRAAGLKPTRETTQNGALYRRARVAADKILRPGGIVISCGWNSTGMGRTLAYEPLEILLVNHGGAHNDTLIVVERKAEPARNDSDRPQKDPNVGR
jgi:hypothetical protein